MECPNVCVCIVGPTSLVDQVLEVEVNVIMAMLDILAKTFMSLRFILNFNRTNMYVLY